MPTKQASPKRYFLIENIPQKSTSGLVQQTVQIVARSALTISQETHL